MRNVLPLLILAGCSHFRTSSFEDECLRLLRCEMAWSMRDMNTLVAEDCDNPKGFSMEQNAKYKVGLPVLDCAWSRQTSEEVEPTN